MPKPTGHGHRLRRGGGLTAVVVGLAACIAACVAACGVGSASPGVASLGSAAVTPPSTPFASSFPNLQQRYQANVSYAQCMRSHGLAGYPDPVISGSDITRNNPYDPQSPRYQSANSACKHLLPAGAAGFTPAYAAALAAVLVKYAQCMRAHGEPNYPDPTVTKHEVAFLDDGIDMNSPRFKAAHQACRALLPDGTG
jgi:hypothetical protein